MITPPRVIKVVWNTPWARFKPTKRQDKPISTINNASDLLCNLKDLTNDKEAKKILRNRNVISNQKCSIQNRLSNNPRDIKSGKIAQWIAHKNELRKPKKSICAPINCFIVCATMMQIYIKYHKCNSVVFRYSYCNYCNCRLIRYWLI